MEVENLIESFSEFKEVKNIDRETMMNILEDVFKFEEIPQETVRLSASTIEQLFKDTNYSLNEVRKSKKVKPIRLSLLPNEIKQIENANKRKNLFIQIILQ